MSRNRFLYTCLVLAIVISGLVAPLFQPSVVVAAQPVTPTNSSPSGGAVGVSLTPTLTASAFDDPGDSHLASQWQIAASDSHNTNGDGSYSTPVYDSGLSSASPSIVVPLGELGYLTTYYWHVRYLSSDPSWSEWSAETTFTTTGPQPNQPSNISPTGSGVSLMPTLQSSAFSDNNTLDTHAASQWQIAASDSHNTNGDGSYSTPVYNSLPSTASTSTVVPLGELDYSITYYWHVKYQDNNSNWSEWSPETSFTTMANQPPDQPTNSTPANAASGQSVTPALASSPFSDDVGDTHAASRWQIRAALGSYTSPVYDNITAVNLTNTVIPAETLDNLATYYWHVSYQDNYGAWSDNSAEWWFTTSANQSPNQPANSSPVDGVGGQSLTPMLVGSDFVDPDPGDKHTASQWQITTTAGNYTSPVYDNVTAVNLTSIVIPSGPLTYFTTYYWHVRYEDRHTEWSAYSAETSFITIANQAPSPPTNLSPANGAPNQTLTPTLQSSAYSDPEGDAHTASRWQITTTEGNYAAPVFDSGTDSTSLTSMAVPPGRLSYSTTYYWHVRYLDSHGNWSVLSAETSFATAANQAPTPPTNSLPVNLATDISLTPTVQSSAFNDPGDTHAASQWQITTASGSYAATVFDNVTYYPNLTNTVVPSGLLNYSVTYYWRVRHQDSQSVWSAWSSETSFRTRPPGAGADFSSDVTALIVGHMARFTDSSTGAIRSWTWDFGDNTKPVTWDVRPGDGKVSHTYALAGTYTVKLTIAVFDKSYTETKTDYIHVYALPHADFSASAIGILLGEAIAFTNTSTGGIPPLAYAWDFDGDGTTDSTEPNPTHSYLVTGTYSVSLKVTDARGNSTTEKMAGYISVGNATAPHVVPPQGGIIQTADGLIAMTFPAGAVGGEATVSIEEVSPPAAKVPGGFQMGNSCFTVRVVDAAGDEIVMFSRLVTITVKYSDEDVAAAGGALENLVLAYYNEATGKWKIVETTLNSTDKSLSATTTHFSTWAILVKTPSSGTALWIQIVIGVAAVLGVGIVIWKLISVKQPDQLP